MKAALLAGLLAVPIGALAQDARPPLAVFGAPLGGTIAQVEQMALSRGYRRQASAAYCRDGEICVRHANIEELPGTDFVNDIWGGRKLPDRTEGFNFRFVAPPNEARAWSIGSDQEFGDWYHPSSAAPLLTDVLAELQARFGMPAAQFGGGGAKLAAGGGQDQSRQLWWLWDDQGRPLHWSDQMRATCYEALGSTAVSPGYMFGGITNAVVNPKPFLLARQGNCAVAARAIYGQTRGLVYSLSIRIVDFRAGHDALFRTNQLLQDKRGQANQQRSTRNRPDF